MIIELDHCEIRIISEFINYRSASKIRDPNDPNYAVFISKQINKKRTDDSVPIVSSATGNNSLSFDRFEALNFGLLDDIILFCSEEDWRPINNKTYLRDYQKLEKFFAVLKRHKIKSSFELTKKTGVEIEHYFDSKVRDLLKYYGPIDLSFEKLNSLPESYLHSFNKIIQERDVFFKDNSIDSFLKKPYMQFKDRLFYTRLCLELFCDQENLTKNEFDFPLLKKSLYSVFANLHSLSLFVDEYNVD